MSIKFTAEYTDTFAGEANYAWLRRGTFTVPELTHYGYDGSTGYAKASRLQRRQLMILAKRHFNMTGVRGETTERGDVIEFRPYGMSTVLFLTCEE